MIALRKLKDLENVCLFDRVLVRMDFDFRLMNCRYSSEVERPLSQKAAGLYEFQHWGDKLEKYRCSSQEGASWAWNSASLCCISQHFLDALQTSGQCEDARARIQSAPKPSARLECAMVKIDNQ